LDHKFPLIDSRIPTFRDIIVLSFGTVELPFDAASYHRLERYENLKTPILRTRRLRTLNKGTQHSSCRTSSSVLHVVIADCGKRRANGWRSLMKICVLFWNLMWKKHTHIN